MSATTHADTVDVADILRAVKRGRAGLLVCLAVGLAGAVAVLLWAPRKFDGAASLVIRSSPSEASLFQGGGDLTSILGNGTSARLETEIAILQSQALADPVIDSLRLPVRVRAPAGTPAAAVVAGVNLPGAFKPLRIVLDRSGTGYTVQAPGGSFAARVGEPILVRGAGNGAITLRPDTTLPAHIELQLFDREDAAARFGKALAVAKVGGDVVRVAYRADDSVTAARVPNLLITQYLAQRHTTDRGVNQHRVEFLAPRVDSASARLAAAEDSLRQQQERSSDFDPATTGRVAITQLADLRGQIYTLAVEQTALDTLLDRVARHQVSARDVAAFPTFIKSAAITELISQLSQLDADRLRLLASRTPQDPDVLALTHSIAAVEGQLEPIGHSYASSIAMQRAGLQHELDSLHSAMAVMPRDLEATSRLEADVKRLGAVYAGLETQLIQARLAAIGEGGDARQLDVATFPKRPAFPQPLSTLALGLGGGLVAGIIAALLLSVAGRWARDPFEVERLAGVPALQLDPALPLLIGGQATRTVLVLPLDAQAPTAQVAQQIAETSLARSVSATVLDLTAPASELNAAEAIERLEREFGHVVVRLPDIASRTSIAAMRSDRPVLLVGAPGRVHKAKLNAALGVLRRMEVPCAGVLMPPALSPRVLLRTS